MTIKITGRRSDGEYAAEVRTQRRYGPLWLKKRTVVADYVGSGTVWHRVGTGRRPGTRMEEDLCSAAWQWREAKQL